MALQIILLQIALIKKELNKGPSLTKLFQGLQIEKLISRKFSKLFHYVEIGSAFYRTTSTNELKRVENTYKRLFNAFFEILELMIF